MDPQALAGVQQLLTQMGIITAPPSFTPLKGEDNRGSPMQAPGGGQSGAGGGGSAGGQSGGMSGAGSGFGKLLGGLNPTKLLSGILGGGTPSAANPAGSMPVQTPTPNVPSIGPASTVPTFAQPNGGMSTAPTSFNPIGTPNSQTPIMAPNQAVTTQNPASNASVGPYGALAPVTTPVNAPAPAQNSLPTQPPQGTQWMTPGPDGKLPVGQVGPGDPTGNVPSPATTGPAPLAGTPTAALFGLFDPNGNMGGLDNTGTQMAAGDMSGGLGGFGGSGGDTGMGGFGGIGSLFG